MSWNSVGLRRKHTRWTKDGRKWPALCLWPALCPQFPTIRRKYMPKFNILLKPFSLNPPVQKVYRTHNKAVTIVNLAEIRNFFKTEYTNS